MTTYMQGGMVGSGAPADIKFKTLCQKLKEHLEYAIRNQAVRNKEVSVFVHDESEMSPIGAGFSNMDSFDRPLEPRHDN